MRSVKARQELSHRLRLNEPVRSAPPKHWFEKSASLLGEYVVRNPLALLTAAALTVGGLLLMGFFLRIRFMPDVDLAGSMALIFAAAIVGIGTLTALVLATVLPGVGMRYLLDQAQMPLNRAAVLTTAGPAVLMVTLAVLSPLALEPAQRPNIWVIVIGCLIIASIASAIWVRTTQRDGTPLGLVAQVRKVWPLTLCSVLWSLGLLQVLQAAIQMGVESPHPSAVTMVVLGCWLLMIASINVAVAHLPLRVSLVAGPLAGIFSVILLTMLTGSYSAVSATTVKTLGIGEVHGINLILTSDMCHALAAAPSALHCESMADKATVGILKDVTIVSRIGSNVVVEGTASKADPTPPRPRLILRKDAVIAWTTSGVKAP